MNFDKIDFLNLTKLPNYIFRILLRITTNQVIFNEPKKCHLSSLNKILQYHYLFNEVINFTLLMCHLLKLTLTSRNKNKYKSINFKIHRKKKKMNRNDRETTHKPIKIYK